MLGALHRVDLVFGDQPKEVGGTLNPSQPRAARSKRIYAHRHLWEKGVLGMQDI